jgi:hypothetical protein
MSRPLYVRGKSSICSVARKLGVHQGLFEGFGEEKNCLLTQGNDHDASAKHLTGSSLH